MGQKENPDRRFRKEKRLKRLKEMKQKKKGLKQDVKKEEVVEESEEVKLTEEEEDFALAWNRFLLFSRYAFYLILLHGHWPYMVQNAWVITSVPQN